MKRTLLATAVLLAAAWLPAAVPPSGGEEARLGDTAAANEELQQKLVERIKEKLSGKSGDKAEEKPAAGNASSAGSVN